MTVIRAVEFGPPVVDQEIVETLEKWLERAKQGDLRGVGIFGVRADGSVTTEFFKGERENCNHHMVSGASMLHHRVVMAILALPS